MSVAALHGCSPDPHAIPDQRTQRPQPWPKVVPANSARSCLRFKDPAQGEVRFDDMARALYSTDASNYRQVPIGVVIPKTISDVIATLGGLFDGTYPLLGRTRQPCAQLCQRACPHARSWRAREVCGGHRAARSIPLSPLKHTAHGGGATHYQSKWQTRFAVSGHVQQLL